jgi:hypothetical protein
LLLAAALRVGWITTTTTTIAACLPQLRCFVPQRWEHRPLQPQLLWCAINQRLLQLLFTTVAAAQLSSTVCCWLLLLLLPPPALLLPTAPRAACITATTTTATAGAACCPAAHHLQAVDVRVALRLAADQLALRARSAQQAVRQ